MNPAEPRSPAAPASPPPPAGPDQAPASRDVRGARTVGAGVQLLGTVWLHGGGEIHLGAGVVLDGRAAPLELHALPGSEIRVGAGARIGPGCSIESMDRVELGDGAVLGPFCRILDTHFHPLHGDRFGPVETAPVSVGAGAQLGPRVILLQGSRVPAGAVVQPGSVVSGRPGAQGAGSGDRALHAVRLGPQGRLGKAALAAVHVAGAQLFLRRAKLGALVRTRGRVVVRNEGTIRIGRRSNFGRGPIPAELVAHRGAELSFGERCDVNYGVLFEAHRSIRIGARSMFGANVVMCDRAGDVVAPITIGEEVWLAHAVVVCPGVTIGDGSIVAAGSVVTRDIPPGMLAIGNPARAMTLRMRAREPAGAPDPAPPRASGAP